MLTFVTRLWSSQPAATPRRNTPDRRPRFRPHVEGFEDRVVPAAPASLAPALVAPAQAASPLSITGINLTNLTVTGANALSGTLNLVGQVAGQNFNLPIPNVPISVNQTGTTADGCPILHLELQIPDLNVLGLHVQLDDCNNGPVTVDITAHQGGGLLGDLLCGLTNGGLLDLNAAGVTGALQQALNGVLGGLLGGVGGVGGVGGGQGGSGGHGQGQNHQCDLVNLDVGPIDLNVLGLEVQTSEICLDVYAQRGGGILGDLLCNVDQLLSRNKLGNAVNSLAGQVVGILNGLPV